MSEVLGFLAPATGICIPMEEVKDPVFSQKMMGDGFAIIPMGSVVVSPIDGEVVMVFPTMHAIGIMDNQGNEMLLHLGLQSFNLKGKGLKSTVVVGQKVKAGETLISFDLSVFHKEHIDPTLVVVFLNGQKVSVGSQQQTVEHGKAMLLVVE